MYFKGALSLPRSSSINIILAFGYWYKIKNTPVESPALGSFYSISFSNSTSNTYLIFIQSNKNHKSIYIFTYVDNISYTQQGYPKKDEGIFIKLERERLKMVLYLAYNTNRYIILTAMVISSLNGR